MSSAVGVVREMNGGGECAQGSARQVALVIVSLRRSRPNQPSFGQPIDGSPQKRSSVCVDRFTSRLAAGRSVSVVSIACVVGDGGT